MATNKTKPDGTPVSLKLQIKEANALIEKQADEIATLKQLLARENPNALVEQMADPVWPPNDELCNKVLAMGEVGASPVQIQAEFMWTKEQWTEALNAYPKFKASVSRARARAIAVWHQRSSDAMARDQWKFQIEKVQRFLDTMFADDERADGDASRLVHVAFGDGARDMFSRAAPVHKPSNDGGTS